jgi:hypothetical protein
MDLKKTTVVVTNKIAPNKHLIIIGAMKCGTTTLFDLLATHPEISPSIRKEPEFFSENQGHKLQGITDYIDLWPAEALEAGNYLLEASTGYTKYPSEKNVAQRMSDYGIKPKIIYMVREPLARIESQLNWGLASHWFSPSWPITDDRYVCPSMYFLQISKYLDCFPKEDILILDFENFTEDVEAVAARTASFLGIDNLFDPYRVKNRNRTRRATVAEHLVYRNEMLHKAFWAMPNGLRRQVRRVMRRTPSAERIRLTKTEREDIRMHIADDMRQFGETFGFPVAKWGF